MADNTFAFLGISTFEWDDNKNRLNLAKHSIDFEDAVEILDHPLLLHRSDRNNEERWVAIGHPAITSSPLSSHGEMT